MTHTSPLPSGKARRPLRPLYGIPERERRDHTGLVVSTLVHALIIVVLLLPPFLATQLDLPLTQGGGGPGPAGGGGGGMSGSGGAPVVAERLNFLQVAPPRAAAAVVAPPPKPEPKPELKVEPIPPPPQPEANEAASATPESPVPGAAGGSGHDGSTGAGPGAGGGVGSGAGTGRGSANGPGTGGGPGDIYPPQVTNLALLPIPVPNKVRPYRMVAWFDVDERGNAKLIAFNPSKDGSYNKKIRDMLAEVRFRPAVRGDGTPVRDTVSIIALAPN